MIPKFTFSATKKVWKYIKTFAMNDKMWLFLEDNKHIYGHKNNAQEKIFVDVTLELKPGSLFMVNLCEQDDH